MSYILEIAARAMYRFRKPVRDSKYRSFLRRFPCVVCQSTRWIEAAHFGPHGIGQKASDLDGLPLCAHCHRVSPKSYHRLGAREFIRVHNLDVEGLIQMFNGWYAEQQGKRAA